VFSTDASLDTEGGESEQTGAEPGECRDGKPSSNTGSAVVRDRLILAADG
jgi:hypothetical protein